MDINDYKRIYLKFEKVSQDLLLSDLNNYNPPMYRFKNFIDKEPTIKTIIDNKIEDITIDFRDVFPINPPDWAEVNIPKEEEKHVKAMYDYMTYIVENDIDVMKCAFNYLYKNNVITEIIRNFINIVFLPLIKFIENELKIEMAINDNNYKIYNDFRGVNGQNNFAIAGVNSNAEANNNVIVNDYKEILDLIDKISNDIDNIAIEKEEKDNFIDDLDIVKEQLVNSIDKPTRLKKAINGISNFLIKMSAVVSGGTIICTNISKLVEQLSRLV